MSLHLHPDDHLLLHRARHSELARHARNRRLAREAWQRAAQHPAAPPRPPDDQYVLAS